MKYLISLITALLITSLTQAQFMSKERYDLYMKYVPKGIFTEDELSRIIFYDRQSSAPAFQHDGRFYYTSNNFSADRDEPFGNPNREFPWNTGGLDNSDNGF